MGCEVDRPLPTFLSQSRAQKRSSPNPHCRAKRGPPNVGASLRGSPCQADDCSLEEDPSINAGGDAKRQ